MADNLDKSTEEKNNEETKTVVKQNGTKTEEITEIDKNIITQVEYYFGDCNLPRDKFLQEQIKLDDGWVLVEVLTKFNRLAKLSTDVEFIVSALKKSDSGLLQVSEDNKKIRRDPSNPLPEMNEARRQEMMTRTIYIKGFPLDTKLDTLLEFFAKFGKVEQLIMRKQFDKAEKLWKFKGSVFAVFPSIAEGEKFIKLDNFKYEDKELIVKWQKNHRDEKKAEKMNSKFEKQNKKQLLKGDNDDNEEDDKSLPKGASLHFTDCHEDLTREDLKAVIEEFGVTVAFVNFNKGEKEGWVRLFEAGAATKVMENSKDGKLEIKEKGSISIRVLEGEEEEEYLEKVTSNIKKRWNFNKKNGRNKKGKGFGNKFNRKRKGSPSRDQAKKAAVESTS